MVKSGSGPVPFAMSGLPPKADITQTGRHVRFGARSEHCVGALRRLHPFPRRGFKSLIGWYLGQAAPGSTYGAAGALIVLLLWTYYSAQIFLFGAEITKAISGTRASDAGQSREAI